MKRLKAIGEMTITAPVCLPPGMRANDNKENVEFLPPQIHASHAVRLHKSTAAFDTGLGHTGS